VAGGAPLVFIDSTFFQALATCLPVTGNAAVPSAAGKGKTMKGMPDLWCAHDDAPPH